MYEPTLETTLSQKLRPYTRLCHSLSNRALTPDTQRPLRVLSGAWPERAHTADRPALKPLPGKDGARQDPMLHYRRRLLLLISVQGDAGKVTLCVLA